MYHEFSRLLRAVYHVPTTTDINFPEAQSVPKSLRFFHIFSMSKSRLGLTYLAPKRMVLDFHSDWLDSFAATRVKCSEDVERSGCISWYQWYANAKKGSSLSIWSFSFCGKHLSIYLSIYIYYIYIYISTSIRHGLLSQFHQNFSHIYIYISTSIYLHLYILIFIYIYFYLSLSIHPAIDLHSDCKIALATFTPTSTATISRPVPNSWPWIHSMAWMIRWMQKWQLSTHVHRNTLW